MKRMTYIVFIILAVLALGLWVRLAPSDPAIWHVAVAEGEAKPGPCIDKITEVRHGARATCLLPGSGLDILTRLDAVAMANPRTTRLAGSPAEGRITWISRSRLMGYPDYITAEVAPNDQASRLDILSRQRFGEKDMGVNAARLKTWLDQF